MNGFWNSIGFIPITLSFLFLFPDLFAAPTSHLCHPEQRDAILEIKNEFKIKNPCFDVPPKTVTWVNNSDCCYWEGIRCDASSGDVIMLNLSNSCLHGQLRLQNLHFVTTLDLSNNHFRGKIPSSLGNLSKLTTLDLSRNHFSGEIPSSLGHLSKLTTLDLSQNNLVGEITFSFGSLKTLTSLSVENNKLIGNFHLTLLNLTKLSELSLYGNKLVGTLPVNISSISNLEFFYVSRNTFTGTIPSSLFTIPFLTYIDLTYNQLNGTLDLGNISLSSKIEDLRLGNNNFMGSIPPSISKLVNLERLDLSHLNTQGLVDLSIFSHIKSLKYLHLSHLKTTTTFDLNAILPLLKSLSTLDLSGNHVSSGNRSLISDPSLLSELYLSGCGITEFPEIIRTQYNMRKLDISNNRIKKLPVLEYVNLSNNTLIGFERPTKHGLSLSYLSGANNNFTGKIPSFICGLRSLAILDLSINKFNGSFRPCIGNFSSVLQALNLQQNRLSGVLPENISESLRWLDVGHNQLVGKLPRSLISISFLEVINVESNRINDTFPFWLSSLSEIQVLVLRSNAFRGPIKQTGFSKLRILDISSNHFSEALPSDCFVNWTAMFSQMNEEEEDQPNGKYMGSSYYTASMVLKERFQGPFDKEKLMNQ